MGFTKLHMFVRWVESDQSQTVMVFSYSQASGTGVECLQSHIPGLLAYRYSWEEAS